MHFVINFMFSAGFGSVIGSSLGKSVYEEIETTLPENLVTISIAAFTSLGYFACGFIANKVFPQGLSWSLLVGVVQIGLQFITGILFALGIKINLIGLSFLAGINKKSTTY